MSQRILVTGAAGFIGSHTCCALLDSGCTVIGMDNFDPFYERALKEKGLAPLRENHLFSFFEGDIRNAEFVNEVVRQVDVIVHLAARAGVRPSIEHPELYSDINVVGTSHLLEAARRSGIRRFVFGSSSSVYGDATPVPFREDYPAINPISPYAATKRAGELLCEVYASLYNMRIASLRLFTVYGARQRPDLAIHKFTRQLSSGRSIQQFGDGSTERDYTYIDDILQGVSGAVEWTARDGASHEIFNLGESRTVPLEQLICLICESLGVEPVIERLPEQPGDVKCTCADITKAQQTLGYQPSVTLEEGIPKFVRWYEETYGCESRATS